MNAHIHPVSSIPDAYAYLKTLHPNWDLVLGVPDGNGWLRGSDLLFPDAVPFRDLIQVLGARRETEDRRAMVASFSLRFGWSAGVAIAPFLLCRAVPNMSLDNISLKFGEYGLLERVALHRAEGVIGADEGQTEDLRRYLRQTLVGQATPIVDALHAWSRFSVRAIWGMITSSWGSQFVQVMQHLDVSHAGWTEAEHFFDGDGEMQQMRPHFYDVSHQGRTRVFHRRSACCRYYLMPEGNYCASCPLIPQEESIRRNKEWMAQGNA